MAKEKIIDKVKLEVIIDDYLTNDVPLSLLTEKYELTYPQIQLLLNRVRGYARQTDKLSTILGDYNNEEYPENYLVIPHEIEEKYPLKHDDQMNLFQRLDELKILMEQTQDGTDLVAEITSLEQKVSSYDKKKIKSIEGFIKELDSLKNNSGDNIAFIMHKYGITPSTIQELSSFYNRYLEDCKKLTSLKEEKLKIEEHKKNKKTYENEYQNLREELFVRNIKLVNWCIRRFFNNIPLPKDETQMYGAEGLVRAINGFDYTLGFHFSTYAVPTIVHHIERYFNELYGMDWEDFISKESIKYYRKLMREENPERKTDATPNELADTGLINLSARKIASYDEMIDTILPFADVYEPLEVDIKPTRKNEMPMTFEDYDLIDEYEDRTLISSEIDEEELIYSNSYLRKVLLEVLSTLPERERKVLIMRYGLDDEPMKLDDVGAAFNVTRERVRQIEAKGLRKLRHPMRSKHLRVFYDGGSCSSKSYSSILNHDISKYEKSMSKLIDLLTRDISHQGLITFMNMDNLNWTYEDLNKKVLEIHMLLERANELEFDSSDLKDWLYSSKFIRISKNFADYLCKNFVQISDSVNNYIDQYIPAEEQKALKKG